MQNQDKCDVFPQAYGFKQLTYLARILKNGLLFWEKQIGAVKDIDF